ncbi:MAG TPA: ABC transporter ATP-binding protein [Candidatus Limiplasma sp.]|nr:ABC transporter ATP-binding protein [Candidatus Limiplasma sp.]
MNIYKNTRRLIGCGDKKSRYVSQLVMVIMIGLLDVAAAHALGLVTRSLTASGAVALPQSFWYFASATILGALLEWLRSIRMTRLTETAESNYRKITARALLRAEYQSLQKMESGDIISRVVADCRYAASNSEHLITGLRSVIIPLILVVVMFVVDWRVGIGYSVPLALVLFYPRLTKRSLSEIPAFRKSFAAMSGQIRDLIQNRTTIKAYRLQKKADQWTEEAVEDYRKKGIRGIGKVYTANISALVINVLPMFGAAIVGAGLLFQGQFAIESFVITIILASSATSELLRLPNVLVNFPSGVVAGDRLFAMWDLPGEAGGTQTEAGAEQAVSFENVSFRYAEQDESDPPLLRDLSFTVKPGEKVALVGPSGCGKSTIIKLITGLYKPQAGTVKVLGRDVRDWDLTALREKMSVLQQDTFVFKGTVKDNILLGNQSADDFSLAIAVENAKLTQWVGQQENGWNADAGEHGALLSGGLKQRMGLARLFLKDAPIELLDEATSALDASHQMEILNALRESGTGKTRVMIAHRLSTVTDADRILFLQEGRIAEEGTHEQLLQKRGLYYRLFTAQEKGEDDGKQ